MTNIQDSNIHFENVTEVVIIKGEKYDVYPNKHATTLVNAVMCH